MSSLLAKIAVGTCGPRQQPLARGESRAIAEIALLDRSSIAIETGFGERVAEAAEAVVRGDMIGVALDEADVAVAEIEQIAGHLLGRGMVVDAHVEARHRAARPWQR